MLLKRIGFTVVLFFFFSPVSGQSRLPHYFPEGIETIQEPARQWEAYLRYINAVSNYIDKGKAPRIFAFSMRREQKVNGKKITFIFDPYVRTQEGKISFFSFGSQKIISEEEFRVAADYFIRQFKIAAEYVFEWNRELFLRAVKARAEAFDITADSLMLMLESRVPGGGDITWREMLFLPKKITSSDLPDEVHLGYGSFLGAAWLHSGVIYITIPAMVVDHLFGVPLVMIHEIIHSNPELQNYPLSNWIDLELLASIPEMLLSNDKISLIYHSYLRELRESLEAYFSFDFERARNEVILWDHARNFRIDVDKFNENAEKLEIIKKELLWFFKEIAVPEYYGDPIYWTSVNDKLVDDIGVFRIMLSLHYNPTLLDGEEKTMKWLKTNESKIKEMALEAFRKSGKPGILINEEDKKLEQISVFMKRVWGIDEKTLRRLGERYGIRPEEFIGKDITEVLDIILYILEQENNQQERKEAR